MTTPTPPGDQNSGFGQPSQGPGPQGQHPQGAPNGPQGGGQPYGAPQQGQPNPGQPGQPQFGQAQPKNKGAVGRVAKGLIGVVVVVAVLFGMRLAGDSLFNQGPKVGTCVEAKSESSKSKVKKVDCGDSAFNYTVVKKAKTSGECANEYTVYSEKRKSKTTYWCLMPNMVEGKCYSGNSQIKETACGPSSIKIVKRIENSTDKSACTNGTQPLVYDISPTRVYCATSGT